MSSSGSLGTTACFPWKALCSTPILRSLPLHPPRPRLHPRILQVTIETHELRVVHLADLDEPGLPEAVHVADRDEAGLPEARPGQGRSECEPGAGARWTPTSSRNPGRGAGHRGPDASGEGAEGLEGPGFPGAAPAPPCRGLFPPDPTLWPTRGAASSRSSRRDAIAPQFRCGAHLSSARCLDFTTNSHGHHAAWFPKIASLTKG